VATFVHYGVLTFNLNVLNFSSVAFANMAAAVVGIGTSFLGSRYFVFRETDNPIVMQAMKFGLLYGVLAVLHFLVLLVWTDWLGLDYRLGFLIATGCQVSLSYIVNKLLVFKK
jgi:putative flippase GtrA